MIGGKMGIQKHREIWAYTEEFLEGVLGVWAWVQNGSYGSHVPEIKKGLGMYNRGVDGYHPASKWLVSRKECKVLPIHSVIQSCLRFYGEDPKNTPKKLCPNNHAESSTPRISIPIPMPHNFTTSTLLLSIPRTPIRVQAIKRQHAQSSRQWLLASQRSRNRRTSKDDRSKEGEFNTI